MMDNVTLADAWGWLLAAAAAVVALSKAWDVIWAKLKPGRDLRNQVQKHSEMLNRDKGRLESLEHSIQKLDEANGVLFRAMFAQINHEISGNGNDILRQSRDELQNYLTNR